MVWAIYVDRYDSIIKNLLGQWILWRRCERDWRREKGCIGLHLICIVCSMATATCYIATPSSMPILPSRLDQSSLWASHDIGMLLSNGSRWRLGYQRYESITKRERVDVMHEYKWGKGFRTQMGFDILHLVLLRSGQTGWIIIIST